jgi:hypothetical protein
MDFILVCPIGKWGVYGSDQEGWTWTRLLPRSKASGSYTEIWHRAERFDTRRLAEKKLKELRARGMTFYRVMAVPSDDPRLERPSTPES